MKKKCIALLLAALMMIPCAYAYSEQAFDSAETLYTLGLFGGTGVDADGQPIYDLDRAPTRNQAVILLVRLLGKEEEALAGEWTLPFTDVAPESTSYAYIGYAYAHNLTSGTSATTYSGEDLIRSNQFLTFVLRALGYTSGTDFKVSTAAAFADSIGLTHGEYADSSATFTRGDVALICANALELTPKGSELSLREILTPGKAVEVEEPLVLDGMLIE